ncbi:MAG TPA: hypothetical protein VGP81_13925, partial [Pyrinomonadaceae bacterium]|nr:hypothetical protein [Pyrinomonadaceae bacterium]
WPKITAFKRVKVSLAQERPYDGAQASDKRSGESNNRIWVQFGECSQINFFNYSWFRASLGRRFNRDEKDLQI